MAIHNVLDLLALAPYRLGFWPHDSLVAIATGDVGAPCETWGSTHRDAGVPPGEHSVKHGEGDVPPGEADLSLGEGGVPLGEGGIPPGTGGGTRAIVGMCRVDLSDLTRPDHGLQWASDLVSVLARQDPDGIVLIAYVAEPFEEARRSPEVRQGLSAMEAASVDELAIEAVWLVTPDGWGHVEDCPCCPAEGYDTAEIHSSPLATEMIVEGRTLQGSREDLAVMRTADGDARLRAEVGLDLEVEKLERMPRSTWRNRAAAQWDKALAHWEEAGPALRAANPERLGRLLLGLVDPQVRDALVAAALSAGTVVDHLPPEASLAVVDAGPRPGPVLRRVAALLEQVAAHAPTGEAAPPLAVLAYLSWWGDDGARAGVVACQALSEDPDHRLAGLVLHALDSATPPPWVGAGRAA